MSENKAEEQTVKSENAKIERAYLLVHHGRENGEELRIRYKEVPDEHDNGLITLCQILLLTLQGPRTVTLAIGKVFLELLNGSPEDRAFMEKTFDYFGLYVEDPNAEEE